MREEDWTKRRVTPGFRLSATRAMVHPVTTPPSGVFQKENKGDNLTAWERGAKRTSGSSAGGIDTVLERMEEQDEIYRKMEKRKLELQEEDMQQRKTERHRSAMRERGKKLWPNLQWRSFLIQSLSGKPRKGTTRLWQRKTKA